MVVMVALTCRKQEMLDGFLANIDQSKKQVDGLGKYGHRHISSIAFKVGISGRCKGKRR